MERRTITATIVLLALASATHAEILRIESEPRDLVRNIIGNYKPRLPQVFHMEVWQDSLTLEVDTDTQMGRIVGGTWHTSGVDRTIASRVDYAETIPQPFPDPPIVRTHSIDVTTSYNWPAMNGSLLTGEWAPVLPACCGQWYIYAPLDDGGQPDFSVTGTYTLQGETESFTSDFSYSVASRPTETRIVLHSPHFFQADAAYYHLIPDERVVFDGTIDGPNMRFTLPDIWLPVMLPEPHGLAALFLPGLIGLLWSRRSLRRLAGTKAITAAMAVVLLASTAQAEIVSVTQKGQRRLQLSGHDIFFTGRNIGAGVPYGYQNSMAFEVDLDTRLARVTEATFSYEPVSRTVSHTRDYTRSVAQPWPDPPIVETTTITESMTFSWGGVSGSFGPTDWAPLLDPYQPRFVFPLASENPLQFSLTGTYSVVGLRDSFTRDFAYTIEEIPESTLAVIQGFHASAVPAMYRLVPSQSTINATVDGVEFSARLNTLRVPVTVPEPSGLFLAVLAGLGLLRRR